MADDDVFCGQRPTVPGPNDDPEFALPFGAEKSRSSAELDGPRGSPFFIAFSIIMGIFAPLFCLAVQEGMHIDDIPGLRFIHIFWPFSYGVIGLEILVLSVWLALADRLGSWCGLVSGMLLAGSLFAGVLGLVLLPFSLIGLLVLFGVFGLVPLFTACVYYLNAVRAYRSARSLKDGRKLWAAPILGMALIFGIPGLVQVRVSLVVRSAIRQIADGNPDGMERLRDWFRSTYQERMVWWYLAERDPARRERLASAYKTLTGEDIDAWARRLND